MTHVTVNRVDARVRNLEKAENSFFPARVSKIHGLLTKVRYFGTASWRYSTSVLSSMSGTKM
jgi:hypothetical protein